MSGVDAPAPWRIAFDNARDPYTARNALGAEKIGGGGGGGGGAPDNAEYIVAATDATLTAERVLTDTASITWDFTTPGQAKASTAAGGGNVSNSGTPTLGQYAKWVTSTTIQGVSAATVLGDIGAQPAGSYAVTTRLITAGTGLTGGGDLSADRTLDVGAGTGITVNANDVALTVPVSVANGGTGSTSAGGALTSLGAQPLDATLTALAAYNTNGLLTQTAADTFTGRSIAVPAAGISITNANGVAGNPTLALANDLASLEAAAGTNTIYYRSAVDTWSAVTVSTGLSFTGGNLTATGGGGNVSNSGTPTAGQVAEWATSTTIAGVSTYAKLASPTFTGTPTLPTGTIAVTQSVGNSSTAVATTAFVDAEAVAKAGDTMTGDLTINKTAPGIILKKAAGTNASVVTGMVGTTTRWSVVLGDGTAESGSDVGSDFTVYRYNDAGTFVAQPLAINRATGTTTLTGLYINNVNDRWLAGNIVASVQGYKPGGGSWIDSSDIRIKNVIGDYTDGLAAVNALKPVRFTYKGNDTPAPPAAGDTVPYKNSPHYTVAKSATQFIGFRAQQIEDVFPQLVTQQDGYIDGVLVHNQRMVDTNALIYALVNSVQELLRRVEVLENKVG